jgi:predicted MFS family arabinose efflux permease
MRAHLTAPRRDLPKVKLLDSMTAIALVNSALIMSGVFAVVPNISAFVQHNMGYPRERIGLLYLVGGLASFVAMRLVGVMVDRLGATPMIVLGTVFHVVALVTAFIYPLAWLPVLFIFTVYMLSGSVRMVPMQALASRVPRPEQRARFMSAQSAVQHAASATGSMLASTVLIALPDGKLEGMPSVAWAALVVACLVPLGAGLLEKRVRAREGLAVSG